jgi:hypothetical protein
VPKFVKADRVGVSDEAGNTVYVARTLNFGQRVRIQEASGYHESLLALYTQAIVAWDGPDFRGTPCTQPNIEAIDTDDPFWEKVGDKIAELHKHLFMGGAKEDSPLPATTAGEPATTASTPPAAVPTSS